MERPQIEIFGSQSCTKYSLRGGNSSAAGEQVFCMAGHVMNSRKAMQSAYQWTTYFSSTVLLKLRTRRLRSPKWFHSFIWQNFFRVFVGFGTNQWINCHQRWNTLHELLVAYRHTVPGTDTNNLAWIFRSIKCWQLHHPSNHPSCH